MTLHGVDLNLLVAFDALMAERSVTRAGARIGRTQPAMSAALGRLRSLLQDELFIRSSHGLQPTPRALDLAEPLSRTLAEIQRTLEFTRGFDPAQSTATFKLGLSDHPVLVILPYLVDYLRDIAPGITLRVTTITASNDAVSLLDAGEIDIAIAAMPAQVAGRIVIRPIFTDRLVCILRRDHPAAGRLDLEAFLSLSHVLVSPEAEHLAGIEAALAKQGVKRRIALSLPHMYAAPSLVARSDMCATMLNGVVNAADHRRCLCILDPPLDTEPVPFAMFWQRRNNAHPAQIWLRNCIASLAASADSADALSYPIVEPMLLTDA